MITLSELKNYLSLTTTDKDNILTGFINSATDKINAECNRTFEKTEHTEYITCSQSYDTLFLKNSPVNSISSIQYYNGTEYADLIDGSGDSIALNVENRGDYIVLRGYNVYSKDIKIVYNAGYKFITGTGRLRGDIGSTTITGTGTLFTSEVAVNDYISVNGNRYKVTAIASNTSLTISSAVPEDVGLSSYAISNVPEDIRNVLFKIASMMYLESGQGKDLLYKSSEGMGSGASESVSYEKLDIKDFISTYRFINI